MYVCIYIYICKFVLLLSKDATTATMADQNMFNFPRCLMVILRVVYVDNHEYMLDRRMGVETHLKSLENYYTIVYLIVKWSFDIFIELIGRWRFSFWRTYHEKIISNPRTWH